MDSDTTPAIIPAGDFSTAFEAFKEALLCDVLTTWESTFISQFGNPIIKQNTETVSMFWV